MAAKALMPLRWKGDLPDGLRCVVRAGLKGKRLVVVIARGPVGTEHPELLRTTGEAPSTGLSWRARINRFDGYRPLCGTAGKDIVALKAVLDNGAIADTDLIEAEDLPFNLFLAWATPERWVARVEGTDEGGEIAGQISPFDPHTLLKPGPQG